MKLELLFNLFDRIHLARIIKFIKKFEIQYFIDVGAHKGEFLTYLLKLKNIKKIYSILYQNFKNNKKIKFFNIGLGNSNIKKNIYINKLSSTSTFKKNKKTFYLYFKKFLLGTSNNYEDKYEVKINKLDKVLKNKNLKDCLLKIDVEGYELNVLNGSINTIKNQVKFILIEKQFFNQYQGVSHKKVEMLLKKHNFKLIKKFTYPLFHFQDNLYKKV
tara:strand:+ start:88 stop:735 length:648 start_codon:yes stop_codon:yes gene_type:complete